METTIDKKGNAVYNGYSTNLPAGSTQANQAISTGSLAPVAPINLPPVQTVDPATYTGATTGVATDLAGGVANLQQEQAVKDTQATVQEQVNKILGITNDVSQAQAGNVKDYGAEYQKQGVNTLFNQVQDLNAQAQGLNLEAQAIPIQIQQNATGQGVTDRGVAPIQAARLRENALKSLSLGQQYAIASGNYNKAKNYADQIVEQKYAEQEALISSKLTQINALDKYSLTPAQEKLKTAQTALLEKQKQDIADKKEQEKRVYDEKITKEKDISKLLIEASPVAPPDVLQRAKDVQAKGGSATDVAVALGQYGGDYLKNKLLEEQLKTEVSQRAKIASDISVNNAQIRNYDASASKTKAETGAITNPLTGVNLKPLTEVQAKDLLYAQRGEQSASIIDSLQNKIVAMSPVDYTTQKALEGNSLTSGNVSPEIKQLRQAERNFATAVLRKESGAAISPSEFATVEKQYFPRPGDDAQTLTQKKQNRETYISGTKSGVPGYEVRISTPESSYLDTVTKSLDTVSQKTTPTSLYTSKLLGLPGVKQ